MTGIQVKSLNKVLPNIFVFFFLPSHPASPSSRASREFRIRLALRANAALLPRLAHKRLIYRLDPNLRFQSNSIAAWIPFKNVGR